MANESRSLLCYYPMHINFNSLKTLKSTVFFQTRLNKEKHERVELYINVILSFACLSYTFNKQEKNSRVVFR